jgi:hypothetical protein
MNKSFNLFEKRNAFELLNSSFLFVKENSSILKYLAIIAGPFLLLTSYFTSQIADFVTQNLVATNDPKELIGFYMELIKMSNFQLLLIFSLIDSILISLVVYSYFILYEKDEDISFDIIWPVFLENLAKASVSYLFMLVLVFSGMILFVFPGIFLVVPLQLYILIRIRENEALLDGVNRSISLMKGYWTESFFLFMVVYILLAFFETILNFPLTIMGTTTIYAVIYNYFISTVHGFLQFFLPLIFSLQYFNLRAKKEQINLDQI